MSLTPATVVPLILTKLFIDYILVGLTSLPTHHTSSSSPGLHDVCLISTANTARLLHLSAYVVFTNNCLLFQVLSQRVSKN